MDRVAAHRMALDVLDEHRRGGAAVDRDLEDRARLRQGVAQDARVDREQLRPAVRRRRSRPGPGRCGAGGGRAGSLRGAGGQRRAWWRCRWKRP